MYPSGRTLENCYDAAGRIEELKNLTQANLPSYVTGIQYHPAGGITQMTLANGVVESRGYNSRLQLNQLQAQKQAPAALVLGFDYGTTNNNGNLLSETITRGSGSTLTQSYAYDGLNRLAVAAENPSALLTPASNCQTSSLSSNWCEQYGHDPYGNHWVTGPVQGVNLYSFTPQSPTNFNGQNQLIIQGSTYDGAGNQQQIAGFQFQYDAENRMTSSTFTVTNPNTVTNYVYDGDGRRVMKTVGGVTTTYVYDATGQLAAEYGPATDIGTKYLTVDHLGSTRLLTDTNGSPTRCLDYLPFGEEIGNGTTGHPAPCFGATVYPSAPDALTDKFTGKERDAETGMDFFGARYMSAAQGRFTSVDPALESEYLETPQTWNRYSYVYNQPSTLTDPDGRCPQCLPALGVGIVGGLVSVGATAYYEIHTSGTTNNQDLMAAFAGGFVSSGLPVLTLGASLVPEAGFGTLAAVGAGSNVVGGVITRSLDSAGADTSPASPLGMATDVATGVGGALIGNGVGLLIQRDLAPLKPSLRNFGTRAFSAANQAYRERLARLARIAVASSVGVGTAISNAFYTILSAFRPPSPPPAPLPPPGPSLSPSWQSFLTFGCGCIPDVESTVHF